MISFATFVKIRLSELHLIRAYESISKCRSETVISRSSLLFVNVNIEHNKGRLGRSGPQIIFDLYETKKLIRFFFWSVLNLYVYGLKKLLKVIKCLCYSNLKFIKI